MSTSIPTAIPSTLRAGDTWQWRREDLDAYPAPTWTLKYRAKNAAGGFEVTATPDGDVFAITVAAATTATYAAGTYDYVAWVESGANKFTVDSGRLTVQPDLRAGSAGAALDLRSLARQIMERCEAAMLARDPSLASYSIQTGGGARTKTFTSLAEVHEEYERARREVQREEQAASIASGLGNPRRFYVRFGRA